MTISIKQAKQRIKNKWNWNDPSTSYPVILWGPPGIGKSQLIYSLICERMKQDIDEQFFKDSNKINWSDKEGPEYIKLTEEYENKLKLINFKDVTQELLDFIAPHCLVLRLAERPIEQITGVVCPVMNEKDNFARFVMPENLVKVKNSSFGIVFLDELDKASDAKFGAATHILENKVIGDLQLPKNWYVIAAANREEDSHLSNPIPPEIRNRCANIEVEPDLHSWLEWANTRNIRRDFILFHRATGGKWLANYDLEQTYSFPTPRTWVMANNVIDRISKQMNINSEDRKQVEEFDNIMRNELIDFVGLQAATEYFTYRELYLKFNIKEILNGTKRISKMGDGNNSSVLNDQCVAALAVADQVSVDMLITKKDFKNVYNNKYIHNLIQFIEDLEPEIRILYFQSIHKTRIINILLNSGLANNIMDEIIEYIAA